MTESIERFNKYIKKLIDIADSSTDLDKSYIIAANTFFNTTLNSVPTILMDYIGPIIKKNEQLIYTKDDEILNSLSREVSNQCSDKSSSDQESITTVINMIKNKWNEYSEDEKLCIFKILKVLNSEYCKFHAC